MEQTIINEVWRSVDGYMNYQVSNIGRVRNATTGKMMKLTDNGRGYLRLTLTNHEGQKPFCIHQLVAQEFLEKPVGDGEVYEVDHINRNKLDNQVCNLRYVTRSQNNINRSKPIRKRTTSSQYKGVSLVKKTGKWKAQINIDGKNVYIGLFISEQEAAMAYDLKAQEVHSKFAVLNF